MKVVHSAHSAYLLIACMVLSACGGGGEQSPATTPPGTTSSLVADAGRDQSVFLGTVVTLNGSKSTNANQTGLTYTWTLTKPAGSNATLSNPTIVNPTLTVDVEGRYEATLIVKDSQNPSAQSAPDTVIVLASRTNPPPAANAGDDRNVFVVQPVHLSGSGSRDANNDPLTFNWSFTSVPARSNPTLFDSTTVAPSFTPDVEGPYTLQLVVNDRANNSTPDSVTITASHKPAPKANAGSDQFVPVNPREPVVSLDGSASQTNPPTNPPDLKYEWSINASTFSVTPQQNADNPSRATFDIPANTAGTVTAQLKVTDKSHPDPDPKRNSHFDTVNVIVGPLATISMSKRNPSTILSTCTITSCPSVKVQRNASTDSFIELDGSASQGPAPQPALTYEWTGAAPTDSNPAVARFQPDVTGNFTINLIVRNGRNENQRSVTLEVVTGPIIEKLDVMIKGDDNQDRIVNSVPPNDPAVVKATVTGTAGPITCEWSLPGIPSTQIPCTPGVDGATAQIPGIAAEGNYTATLNVKEGTFESGPRTVPFSVNTKPTPKITQTRRSNTPETSCLAIDVAGTTNPPGGFLNNGVTWDWSISPAVALTGVSATPQQKQFTVMGTAGYSVTLAVKENTAPADSASNSVTVSVDLTNENAGHNLYHDGIPNVTPGACVNCHTAPPHDIGHERTTSLNFATVSGDTLRTKLTNKLKTDIFHASVKSTQSASSGQIDNLMAFFATVRCLDRGSTPGH